MGLRGTSRVQYEKIFSNLRVALGVTCVRTHSVSSGCVSHANTLRVHPPVTHALTNPSIPIGVALLRPGCCHQPVRTHSYMSGRDNDLTFRDSAQLSNVKITLEGISPSHPHTSTPNSPKATSFLGPTAQRVYAPVTSHAAAC
jgi:hypothetical protein